MSHPTRQTPEPRPGGSDLSQVLAGLEYLGLIRSLPLPLPLPLPQRSRGRYVSGFGSTPTDYIGAPPTEVARVAAAVREWASQLSRCRDESAPGTGDLTDGTFGNRRPIAFGLTTTILGHTSSRE